MLWKPNLPLNGNWEPFELRELKKKLANIKCDCYFCEKHRSQQQKQPVGDQRKDEGVQSIDINNYQQKDEEVQSVDSSASPQRDEEAQSTDSNSSQIKDDKTESKHSDEKSKPGVVLISNETITDDIYFPSNLPSLHRDIMCPNCYFTLNLLRSGTTKVLKDEEVETKCDILYTCEKSTSKIINTMEKSTSYNKPVLKYPNSTFSEDSFYSQNRGTSIREVTFAFNDRFYGYDDTTFCQSEPSADIDLTSILPELDHVHYEEEEETSSTTFGASPEIKDLSSPVTPLYKQRIDINEFINSIRPPDPEFITYKKSL